MLQKLKAAWGGAGMPWPDEAVPELAKARGELAAAKERFAQLGPQLAEAHRRVMAIKDAPYVTTNVAGGAEAMADRRREYAAAQRKQADLAAERKELAVRINELEPKLQQLRAGASRQIVEQVRPHHAELLRRVFLGFITPIADSIAAQVELHAAR